MASEPDPIRVKPFSSMSNGADPVSYMLELIDQGCDRFYVLVPAKFHFERRKSRSFIARRLRDNEHLGAQETDASIHNAYAPSYLQLNKSQVQDLITRGSVDINIFDEGALFRRLIRSSSLSIDFDRYSSGWGVLEPDNLVIGEATPTRFDPVLGCCMMVKSQKPNSNVYSYSLQGVDFSSVYVEIKQINKWSFNFECKSEAVRIMLEIAERRLDQVISNSIIEKELVPPLTNGKRNRNGEIFDNKRAKFAMHLTDCTDDKLSQGSKRKKDREFNEKLIDDDIRSTRFSVPFKLLLTATRWWESEQRAPEDLKKRLEKMGFINEYGNAEDEVPHIIHFITRKSLTSLNRGLPSTVKKEGR